MKALLTLGFAFALAVPVCADSPKKPSLDGKKPGDKAATDKASATTSGTDKPATDKTKSAGTKASEGSSKPPSK